MPHTLSGKWILHYFDGDIPWRTISDLPEDEALAINRSTGKTSGFCPVTGRELYYVDRLQVEAWDRAQHLARGGRVDNPNPVYAILSEVERPELPYRRGHCLAVPAEEIAPDVMSLTFGDSFPNFYRARLELGLDRGALLGRSYSPTMFASLIGDASLPSEWPAGYTDPEKFCIEVRLYTRALPQVSRPATASRKNALVNIRVLADNIKP